MKQKEELKNFIVAITQETFETLLFLEALPTDTEAVDGAPSEIFEAKVMIAGGIEASLYLQLAPEAAFDMSSHLPGPPIESSDEHLVRDLLGELSNVLGGRLAAAWGGKDFKITLPEVRRGQPFRATSPDLVCTFTLDFGLLRVVLTGPSLSNSSSERKHVC